MKKDPKITLNDVASTSAREKTFRESSAVAISSETNARRQEVIESVEYVDAFRQLTEKVLPNIEVRNPDTFAKYGSAEKYYEDSFAHIYGSYPYDGSRLEKINWSLSASVVDLAVLQYEYPRETGHINVSSVGWGVV